MKLITRIFCFALGLVVGFGLIDLAFDWLTAADSLLNVLGVFVIILAAIVIAVGSFPDIARNLFKPEKNNIKSYDD